MMVDVNRVNLQQNLAELFCNRVGAVAQEAGITESVLKALLAPMRIIVNWSNVQPM